MCALSIVFECQSSFAHTWIHEMESRQASKRDDMVKYDLRTVAAVVLGA